MAETYNTALARLSGQSPQIVKEDKIVTNLIGEERQLFIKGKKIYNHETFLDERFFKIIFDNKQES